MKETAGGEVCILPDLEAVSRRAAEIFIEAANQSAAAHRNFAVALSGGSTPRRLYELLSSERYKTKVLWEHVHFFWDDERCVPREHEASNFKAASDLLLSKVPVPDRNIHRIKGEEGPESAAGDYDADLRKFFGGREFPVFDLVILGVGEDGHTASLFPGSASLREQARLAVPVRLDKPGLGRVTLTLPVLNSAARILFLVSGRLKSGILRDILEAGKRKDYPAGLVHPANGKVIWLLDREAGRELRAAGECR